MKLFVLTLFLLSTSVNAKLSCMQKDLVFKGVSEVKKVHFCYDDYSGKLFSKKCYSKKSCLAFTEKKKKIDVKQVGTPLGRVCLEHSGKVVNIEFIFKKKAQAMKVCLFKDKSFIDLESLFVRSSREN